VRVADRDRDLSDADAARIAERRPGERRAVYSDDRQVGVRVVSNHIRPARVAVGHDDGQGSGVGNHVAVGQDETVWREKDARAAAPPGVDLDDGRSDDLDRTNHRLRVRVEQLIVVRLGAFALGGHRSIVRTQCGQAHYPDGQVENLELGIWNLEFGIWNAARIPNSKFVIPNFNQL